MQAKQILCKNGHAFDASKTNNCPYCGVAVASEGVTAPANAANLYTMINKIETPAAQENCKPAAFFAEPPTRPAWQTEPEKAKAPASTGAMVQNNPIIEPVVGWLLSIAGPTKGCDYRIFTGNNSIGRAPEMRICIHGDDSISREKHAFIVYDPKSIRFILRLGDSQGLVYLNDELVTASSEIKGYDMIELGQTKLLFIPACGEKFKW